MSWSMMLGIKAPYTREELYGLWLGFRDDEHATTILADFMASDRASAAELIEEFERKATRPPLHELCGED